MSYIEDYETWKERIADLPLEQTKVPNQPIDAFAARTETLAQEATKDKDLLAKAGLDVTMIDDLKPLAGALRFQQANWMSEYQTRQEAQKECQAQWPGAFDLRDELVHNFKFAYRGIPDIHAKVMRIDEGSSQVDMIQDLLELAVLGERNLEPITQIGVEVANLEKARTLSHSLSELLAVANGSSDESSELKVLRDKTFTLLWERESTIREYGRYVFWKDASRREKYLK